MGAWVLATEEEDSAVAEVRQQAGLRRSFGAARRTRLLRHCQGRRSDALSRPGIAGGVTCFAYGQKKRMDRQRENQAETVASAAAARSG